LGSQSTSNNLPLAQPKPLPKWAIFTIVDAHDFISSPFECYQEPFPPPFQALIIQVVDTPKEY
jgi:hypothetical protein